MKVLLIALLLLPADLHGQVRSKALADSLRTAGKGVQRASQLISNYPGATVDDVQVSDTGGYVTLLVRVHTAEPMHLATISLAALQLTRVQPATIQAPTLTEEPPLPFIIAWRDTIAMARTGELSMLPITSISFDKPVAAMAPPLPRLQVYIDPLPATDGIALQIIPDRLPGPATYDAPPMPNQPELVRRLLLAPIQRLNIENELVIMALHGSIPAMPDIEPDLELRPTALIRLRQTSPPAGIMDTVTVGTFEGTEESIWEMHLSDEAYTLLEKMEGFSSELYTLGDGGYTIGFGFFVPPNETGKWRKGLSWNEAQKLIREKVPGYEDQVKKYINVPLTQEEFDALTMLAYNLGGFARASSIVNDINTGAPPEKLQRDWMRFVHSKAPRVMQGLMNRRHDELHVKDESDYQPERKIQILKSRKI